MAVQGIASGLIPPDGPNYQSVQRNLALEVLPMLLLYALSFAIRHISFVPFKYALHIHEHL